MNQDTSDTTASLSGTTIRLSLAWAVLLLKPYKQYFLINLSGIIAWT